MRVHVTHRVEKRRHLLPGGIDHPRIGMTPGGDAERARQVEIFFAIGIPDVHAARAFPHDGPRTVRGDESDVARFVTPEKVEDLPGVHQIISPECTRIGYQVIKLSGYQVRVSPPLMRIDMIT